MSRAELVDYYRQAGLGDVLVGVGKPSSTAALTEALLKHLDANSDGKVDEKEWLAAADRLAKLDQNDDELITPGELVPRTTYPGATGANLLTSPSEKVKASAVTESLPLMTLPLSTTDTFWATALVTRLDKNADGFLDASEAGLSPAAFAQLDSNKDGKLSPDELVKWRGVPADVRWAVRLGKRPPTSAEIECSFPSTKGVTQKGERLDISFGSLRFRIPGRRGAVTPQVGGRSEAAHCSVRGSGHKPQGDSHTRRREQAEPDRTASRDPHR